MKKFGFGLMRLPTVGNSYTDVDLDKFQKNRPVEIFTGLFLDEDPFIRNPKLPHGKNLSVLILIL